MAEPERKVSRNPLSRSNPLAPAYICVFLFSAGEQMLHMLVPLYIGIELGARPAVVGTVLAVFAVASLAARFPAGMIYTVDRARALLVVGGVLSAAGAGGGVLADPGGFGPSSLVLAATPAVATAVMVALMPWGKVTRPVSAGNEEARPRLRGAWRWVAGLPAIVWAGMLVMVYINLMSGVVNAFHPLLAVGAGLTVTQVGILRGVRSWASSTVRLGSGVVFARTDGRWMTTPLVVLGALALMLVPSVASSFLLQIPLFLAAGLSRGLLRVTGSAEAFDGVGDQGRHGMVAALLQGGLDLGKLLGPLLGGV